MTDTAPLPPHVVAVNKELQVIAAQIDHSLMQAAGQRVLFSLIVYTGGRFQYISNADRETAKKAIQELLTSWEGPKIIVPPN